MNTTRSVRRGMGIAALTVATALSLGAPADARDYTVGGSSCSATPSAGKYTASVKNNGCTSVQAYLVYYDSGGTRRTVTAKESTGTSTATAGTSMIVVRQFHVKLAGEWQPWEW